MVFTETGLSGAVIVDVEQHADERGFFARSWCTQEFADRGLNPSVVQCNVSGNTARGTLRGMHYQVAPHAEVKLVRCTKGAIYDVIIDLRPESPTFKQWIGEELSAENRRMLYVPTEFAHGFQTLVDDTEVFYQVSDFYAPQAADGIRWNDSAFAIVWPATDGVTINQRDQTYPDFKA